MNKFIFKENDIDFYIVKEDNSIKYIISLKNDKEVIYSLFITNNINPKIGIKKYTCYDIDQLLILEGNKLYDILNSLLLYDDILEISNDDINRRNDSILKIKKEKNMFIIDVSKINKSKKCNIIVVKCMEVKERFISLFSNLECKLSYPYLTLKKQNF